MDEMNVTSEDTMDFFFLQTKLRHKAIEVFNNVHKKVLMQDKEFNPDQDKIEFILDKTYELDEEGNLTTEDFGIPSVIYKIYDEEEKEFKIEMDIPITWLKEDVNHVEAATEMMRLGKLGDERFSEYYDRLEERIKREEIALNLQGDPEPIVNEQFHTDKFIEISETVDKEIADMSKFKALPTLNFTDGMREFLKDANNPDSMDDHPC